MAATVLLTKPEFWGQKEVKIESVNLKPPYLVFIDGGADSQAAVKTAQGIADWAPEKCMGQLRLTSDSPSVGLPDMTLDDAVAKGARTLVIGVSPFGGELPKHWVPVICAALQAGLDVAAGLHDHLRRNEKIRATAEQTGRRVIDVRSAPRGLPLGTGVKRTGKRVLTVGTDCAVGKKYAALAIAREFSRRGVNASFRATGQTGVLIAGEGVVIDSVIADFIAGAAEAISPANTNDHWDIIEGQGALLHPAYGGVSLGLLQGAQPDAFIVCHHPGLKEFKNFSGLAIADIGQVIDLTIKLGRLTNPDIYCAGICLNTKGMTDEGRAATIDQHKTRYGIPVVDPVALGVAAIADQLLQ